METCSLPMWQSDKCAFALTSYGSLTFALVSLCSYSYHLPALALPLLWLSLSLWEKKIKSIMLWSCFCESLITALALLTIRPLRCSVLVSKDGTLLSGSPVMLMAKSFESVCFCAHSQRPSSLRLQ